MAFMPGLLQTEGYIRAITVASFPAAPDDFSERAVALRLARQHLLSRPGRPSTGSSWTRPSCAARSDVLSLTVQALVCDSWSGKSRRCLRPDD
jgi:hypothetical protein